MRVEVCVGGNGAVVGCEDDVGLVAVLREPQDDILLVSEQLMGRSSFQIKYENPLLIGLVATG